MLSRLLLSLMVFSLLLASVNCEASDQSEQSLKKPLENFEIYCYRTGGKYAQISKLANAMKLSPISEELIPSMTGAKSLGGRAFVIEIDKINNVSILLMISKPDACSIYVQGITYSQVRDKFLSAFIAAPAMGDDVGLQITQFYVPGGKTGTKKEARELGLIAATFPKTEFSNHGFTLSFLPPETVLAQFPK